MPSSVQAFITQGLRAAFCIFLGLFVLSVSWRTGWNLVGDPYALGPYMSWLEIIFPLAGLGLWGVFFAQWTLGELRAIHITRWFYLLLFAAVLMVNVLFSVNAENSIGWLCLWLSGSLVLSLQLQNVWQHKLFWWWAGAALCFNMGLYLVFEPLINTTLLMFTAWFMALHLWQQTNHSLWKYMLTVCMLLLGWWLPITAGFCFLVLLTWSLLWAGQYQIYRRKNLWFYLFVWLTLVGAFVFLTLPEINFSLGKTLPEGSLGSLFSVWHGVGMGQLEWAQYINQTTFIDPQSIVSDVWIGFKWWYESGLLLFIWLPCLWLITLGHAQSIKFRSWLFWGIAIFAPSLWLSPGGILLGCFWFFNRQSWQPANPQSVDHTPNFAGRRARRVGVFARSK